MSTTPWPLRSSTQMDLHSEAIGDTIAVGVWEPPARAFPPDADTSPYQLVYVLDGSFALPMAAGICQLQRVDLVRPGFPRVLLVGLDYPEDSPNARTRDYVPVDADPPSFAAMLQDAFPDGVPPYMTSGGADDFLRFMTEELDPLIRDRYNVADTPAGLLGDSHGGTFGTYAFINQSPLFNRYWLGSPGIFTTDTDYAGKFIQTLSSDLVHDTTIFLTLGALEMCGGVELYEDMGASFIRMASALQTTKNERLTSRTKLYPGHTHTTVFTPALNDALLYLYGPHFPES